MQRDILQLGDPRLHAVCAPVLEPLAAEVRALIQDLDQTLAAFRARAGFGRGIAAPQVGVALRVLFLREPASGFTGALLNPRVVSQSPERVALWDDCFSFPDLMVRVSRAVAVGVDYQDQDGQARHLPATGGLAELLQHEIDHLDGVLAVERALTPRSFATRAYWQAQRGRRYGLYRQDDNGHRFLMETLESREAAEAVEAAYAARGHKQLYWVEPLEDGA